MHFPKPIYERVPQFWLLLGLLFMSSGTYLGFDFSLSFLYFGVGALCAIWSLRIYAIRASERRETELLWSQSAAGSAKSRSEQEDSVEQGHGKALGEGTESPA